MSDDGANGLPTDNSLENQDRASPDDRRVLARISAVAGRALLVERGWPPFVSAVAVAILFLAVSWLGLWQYAPREARIAGVVMFAAGLGVALAPLFRLRWPKSHDISARLDRDAGTEVRPASGLEDTLANDKDPVARALWAAHQVRLAALVRNIRVSPPAPRMAERDPYALRFGVALIAFAAAVAAGPELYGRFAAAFDWRGGDATAAAASRIDAWIDPPAYAARPPLVIELKNAEPQKLAVLEDSTLVVRGDPGVVETRTEGGLRPAEEKAKPAASLERRWAIQSDGKATILRGGGVAANLIFAVTPAGLPTIKLTEAPRANLSGSLTLVYKADDRYGLSNARADFALPKDSGRPATRSLVEPPQVALQIPATPNGVGDARTTADLSEHPWAGARVRMTLSATSLSGRTGSSGPIDIALPQRLFHNPLARALVEQRRDLVTDPDQAPKRVDAALGAFAVAPELFDTPANVYLGLKEARTTLRAARTDADLLDVAAMLWALAQQIEDGDMSKAAKDLRAAEQALRDALKRGASDDEIKKLMQELRDAARRFASEMARNNPESGQEQEQQTVDLDKLMDQMEDMARNGSREEAEAMLDQMQEMFENMRGAREAEESPEERQLRKQIDELGKLLRDQQALRDETFKSDQRDREQKRAKKQHAPRREGEPQSDEGGQPPGELGQSGEEGDQSADEDQGGNPGDPELGQRQRELRDRLAEMQRRLKALGMKGEKGFDDAQGDMKEAEGDLRGDQGEQGQSEKSGQGRKGGKSGKSAAVDAQGRALEALREGAKGLSKQMSQQGQGQGQKGRGGYTARRSRPGEQPGADPLGRDREGNQGSENGPLREMGTVSERARRVMEELRRRLSDPNRPADERDYLERLLKHD
ncbi:MAG TPA: TIGR02302 family protein [Roseiarcus sp.]|nr:TIGR02302 family protein [Roseiarcus sp.]